MDFVGIIIVFIHFTHIQFPDCVMYFVWGTLGIVWTVRFYFVNIQKVKTKIILVVNSGETKFSTIIDRELCRHSISLFYYNTSNNLLHNRDCESTTDRFN